MIGRDGRGRCTQTPATNVLPDSEREGHADGAWRWSAAARREATVTTPLSWPRSSTQHIDAVATHYTRLDMLFRPPLAGSILFARARALRCARWTTAFEACFATHKPWQNRPVVTPRRALSTGPAASTLPGAPTLCPRLQAIQQSIEQDLEGGVEPRGFIEVDLTLPHYDDVQISHLSWYSTPYEEDFAAEWDGADDVPHDRRDCCGYDPAFPDLPHETFVCVYFNGDASSGYLPSWYYDEGFATDLQGELLKLVASGQLPAEVEIQDNANWESNKYSLDWKSTSFTETGLQDRLDPHFGCIIMILGKW